MSLEHVPAVFLNEYKMRQRFVVCTAPRAVRLSEYVIAKPWQELPEIVPAMARRP
jgi:hypothetical protein